MTLPLLPEFFIRGLEAIHDKGRSGEIFHAGPAHQHYYSAVTVRSKYLSISLSVLSVEKGFVIPRPIFACGMAIHEMHLLLGHIEKPFKASEEEFIVYMLVLPLLQAGFSPAKQRRYSNRPTTKKVLLN